MRFNSGTTILNSGSKAAEVCFVMNGDVLNISTDRVFQDGAIFGETDIIFKRVLLYFIITNTFRIGEIVIKLRPTVRY
jgi:hypothetical protein